MVGYFELRREICLRPEICLRLEICLRPQICLRPEIHQKSGNRHDQRVSIRRIKSVQQWFWLSNESSISVFVILSNHSGRIEAAWNFRKCFFAPLFREKEAWLKISDQRQSPVTHQIRHSDRFFGTEPCIDCLSSIFSFPSNSLWGTRKNFWTIFSILGMIRKSKSRSLYTGDPEGAKEHYSMIQLFNFTGYFYRNVFTGRLVFYQVVNHIILPAVRPVALTGWCYRLFQNKPSGFTRCI